ncbi:TIM barrel protein [Lachnospiraceae bacterium 54-53]
MGGSPHFFLSYLEYSGCKRVRRLIEERGLQVKIITPENCTYQYQFAAQEREQFEKSVLYFKKALDAGEELGCEIMAVNSGWGYWNEDREESKLATTVLDVKRMLKEVNHPNLKAMIDTTAMGVAGETIDQWFEELGDDIIHMHFIDGNPYAHLIWGDGTHDMKKFLESLHRHSYMGYLGQEITDFNYFNRPEEADLRNMKAYEVFII